MTASETHIRTFDSTLQTTHRWLHELEKIASLENESEAYSVLRVVLHALRDRLPTDEAVQLGAELPMLIRGFYYEGWKPSVTPKKQRSLDERMEPLHKLAKAGLSIAGLIGYTYRDNMPEIHFSDQDLELLADD